MTLKVKDGKVVRQQLITLDVMGKRVRVPFTGTAEEYAKFVAGQRQYAAEKRRQRQRAQRATGAEKVAAIREYMLSLNSHERIGRLVPLIEHETAEVFWPCFIEWWPVCDCAWEWNARLIEIFRRVGPCHDYAHDLEYGDFFYSLPDQITVYRGGSRSRIDGAISWTTDRNIAERFARGHRGIRVPDPVVATGTINKSNVFLATDDRNESEILGLPHVVNIKIAQDNV